MRGWQVRVLYGPRVEKRAASCGLFSCVDRKQSAYALCIRTRRPFPYECIREWKRCTEAVSFEIPVRTNKDFSVSLCNQKSTCDGKARDSSIEQNENIHNIKHPDSPGVLNLTYLLSTARVSGPTIPSTTSGGFAFWNAITHASVSGPNFPSTGPHEYPFAFKYF